jgi:hypothetical protein
MILWQGYILALTLFLKTGIVLELQGRIKIRLTT